MTIAAQQLREYLEAKYPGIRIGRRKCRDTTLGKVSQHSAFERGGYDSNALDIMGGSTGGVPWSWSENVELIQTVFVDMMATYDAWSIRKIFWQVPDHFGHAHVDFWPTITMHKWCGGSVTPTWALSDKSTVVTRDPEPENGRYDGGDMLTFSDWANGLFDLIEDDEIRDLYKAGYIEGDPNRVVPYFVGLRDLGSVGRSAPQRKEIARFVQTSMTSAWLSAAK